MFSRPSDSLRVAFPAQAAIAVAAMVLVSPSAQARLFCEAHSVPVAVSSFAINAQVGDIILNCQRVGPGDQGPYLVTNISATLNVRIRNEITTIGELDFTDARLLVNENESEEARLTSEVQALGGDCNALNEYFPCPQLGVLTNEDRIEWNGVRVAVPGPNGLSSAPFPPITTIRITGMRARIRDLGVPFADQFPPTQVQAFLTLSEIALDRNVLTVAVPIAPRIPPPPPPPVIRRPTLLFPFVTNQSGFDTGIAIANTADDEFGTFPFVGTCLLHFRGVDVDQQGTSFTRQLPIILAGQTVTWTASNGAPELGVEGAPGFRGYMFAECRFPFAHGYAIVTDGFGGLPQLAQGYLPLVIPANTRRGRDGGDPTSGEAANH